MGSLGDDWLGVDVGWVYPAVDSDGNIYRWSSIDSAHSSEVLLAGPVKVTRADGSSYMKDAYDAEGMATVRGRAKDPNYSSRLRGLTSKVVKLAVDTDRGLALENWQPSDRGAWVDVFAGLRSVARQRGVTVRYVNKAWTSLTCPKCGYVDRANRPEQNAFYCIACDFSGQADIVAALNLSGKAQADDFLSEALGVCRNKTCPDLAVHHGRCTVCAYALATGKACPPAWRRAELAHGQGFARWLEKILRGRV